MAWPFGLELLPLSRNDTHPVIEEGNPVNMIPKTDAIMVTEAHLLLVSKERNRIGDGFNPC